MSAFVVSKAHIDYLVHAACTLNINYTAVYFDRQRVDFTNADDIGRKLWATNVASVLYRYPDCSLHSGTMPGPADLDHESLATYTLPAFSRLKFDIVTALKAVDCYEYQSCETPEWSTLPAYQFSQQLRSALIGRLPGYEQAPWEIEEDTRMEVAAA